MVVVNRNLQLGCDPVNGHGSPWKYRDLTPNDPPPNTRLTQALPGTARHWVSPRLPPRPELSATSLVCAVATNERTHLCAQPSVPTECTQVHPSGLRGRSRPARGIRPTGRGEWRGRFPMRALIPRSSHVGHLLSCVQAAFAKLQLGQS